MSTREVTIPVSAAFEKRLAELVWENAPELARQTAAGKLALSLDVDCQAVRDVVWTELRSAINEWVQEQLPAVKKRVRSLKTDVIEKECDDRIRAYASECIDRRTSGPTTGKHRPPLGAVPITSERKNDEN